MFVAETADSMSDVTGRKQKISGFRKKNVLLFVFLP
jgi:hypothetical protein